MAQQMTATPKHVKSLLTRQGLRNPLSKLSVCSGSIVLGQTNSNHSPYYFSHWTLKEQMIHVFRQLAKIAARVSMPVPSQHIILCQYSPLFYQPHKSFYFSRDLYFPNPLIT
jgi:hypothetical protein